MTSFWNLGRIIKENSHSSGEGKKPLCLLRLITRCIYDGGFKRQNQELHGWPISPLVQKSPIMNWAVADTAHQRAGVSSEDAKHGDIGRLVWWKCHVLWRETRPLSPQTSSQAKAWCLPSASGSRVWIMSWKMLFLMRLLWREAELPPRWRRGLAWVEKPDKEAVSSQKPKASALQIRSSPRLVVICFCHMITHYWPKIFKVHFKFPKGMAFSQPSLLNKLVGTISRAS